MLKNLMIPRGWEGGKIPGGLVCHSEIAGKRIRSQNSFKKVTTKRGLEIGKASEIKGREGAYW